MVRYTVYNAIMGMLLLLAVVVCIFLQNMLLTESKNLQYILMWTYKDLHLFEGWKTGQEVFLERKCPASDCYVTSQRDFFGEDITRFDAIVFNGRNLFSWKPSDLPKKRSPHQKYIFFNMESSSNEPICSPVFDNFFNLTATYKLDSDIVYSYILIRNMDGEEVGPSIAMHWTDPMSPTKETLSKALQKKTNAIAWFVSHCKTRGKREKYAQKLKVALKEYNLYLDIYGTCGDLECPKTEDQKCQDMLREKYYFYLSFENSFSEDYVTEKLLTALNNDVVPIVYGGANYSRFLPPGSYLDATLQNPRKLAARIAHIIASPAEYLQFFKWRNHYTYHYPNDLCRLCSLLNNKTIQETYKVYEHFRSWWNPDHMERCRHCRLCHQKTNSSMSLAALWFLVLVSFIMTL